MTRLSRALVVGILIASISPGWAGRLVVRWEAKVNVEVEPLIYDDQDQAWIRGVALSATGKNRAGRAETRLDGVVVAFYDAPPYRFQFPVDGEIKLPPGVKGQEKVKKPFVVGPGFHLIEFYLISIDEKGREVRNGDAAASAKFWIEESLDKEAVKKVDDNFRQTIEALKQEIEQLKQQRDRLTREREVEADRLTAEQQAREQEWELAKADYERRIQDHERRSAEAQKSAVQEVKREGVIVVIGRSGQSVTVDCEVSGRVVRQFSYTFTDRYIASFRIPIGDEPIRVTATYSGVGKLGPTMLEEKRQTIYFSGVKLSELLKDH